MRKDTRKCQKGQCNTQCKEDQYIPHPLHLSTWKKQARGMISQKTGILKHQ